MMKLEVIDMKNLINIMDVVKSILETQDLLINVHKDHIQIYQMNPTRTALISVNIDGGKEFFDGFQCDEDTVIVPIDGFQAALDMFKGFKRVIIELQRDKAVLSFMAKEGRKRKQTTLKLIDEGDPVTDKVDIAYETIVKLGASEFKDAMKDSNSVGEFTVLVSNSLELMAKTKGEKGSNEDAWHVGENMDVLSASVTKSAFPSVMLKDVSSKAEKISDKVMISLQTGAPMTLVYDFPGGLMKMFIAPVLDEGVLNIE